MFVGVGVGDVPTDGVIVLVGDGVTVFVDVGVLVGELDGVGVGDDPIDGVTVGVTEAVGVGDGGGASNTTRNSSTECLYLVLVPSSKETTAEPSGKIVVSPRILSPSLIISQLLG